MPRDRLSKAKVSFWEVFGAFMQMFYLHVEETIYCNWFRILLFCSSIYFKGFLEFLRFPYLYKFLAVSWNYLQNK
jgi:hypothetical protein